MRVISIGLDFLIEDGKTYEDVMEELKKIGIYQSDKFVVIGNDFQGDVTESYSEAYRNNYSESEE